MPLTDKSDLYAAVHEDGINTIVKHLARQRPSLFNYGTALVQAHPELLCAPVEAAPGVTELITLVPPLPLLGADNFGLDYAVQLTDMEIDFHPGGVFDLPTELNPPLGEQKFALRAKVCAGIGCPSKSAIDILDRFFDRTRAKPRRIRGSSPATTTGDRVARPDVAGLKPTDIVVEPPTYVFPTRSLSCFCLELFATGAAAFAGPVGGQRLDIKVKNVELVDLTPDGLEQSLECYLLLVVNHVVLARVNDAVSELLFGLLELGDLGSLSFSASTTVPHNPAIEEDQLKAFLDLEQFELNIPPIVVSSGGDGGDGGGGGGGGGITRTERPRSNTGPAHLTAALSESSFIEVFQTLRDQTTFVILVEPQSILGGVTVSADIRFHLDDGDIDFKNDNTISIDELDIKWDKLFVQLGINLPELCLPQICVPVLGCTPKVCVFSANPDIVIPINIPAVFTSEVSVNVRPKVYYGVGPPNKWMIFLDPVGPVDVDLIDVADTVGDLLEDLFEAAVEALGLPDWVADVLGGPVVETIRFLLDIGDDLGEWIADLVFNVLGISFSIEQLIANYLADQSPIFDFEDPVTVLPASGPLTPVRVPIEFLGARVNTDELILEADVEDAP